MSGVKVIFNKERLVVPYGRPSDKVKRLLDDIGVRLRRVLGKSSQELRFLQLKTDDGFVLEPEDILQDVLAPGAVVVPVDADTWLSSQEELLDRGWTDIRRSDFEDKVLKWFQIGMHQHQKLYAALWLGKKLTYLELFPLSELAAFKSEGEHVFFKVEGKGAEGQGNWEATAKFLVKQLGGVFVATSVLLSLRTCSDIRAKIVKVDFTADHETLKCGEITTVQEPYVPPVGVNYQLKLASDVRKGSLLPDVTPEVKAKAWEGNVANAPSGGGLKAEQLEPVMPEQNWRNTSTGAFYNNFNTLIRLSNTSEKGVTLTKIAAEIKGADGKWRPAEETYLGSKYGFYNYSYQDGPYNVEFEAGSSEIVAVRSCIKIVAQQIDRHRRIHSSLPAPLPIRITFTDDSNRTTTLEVECGNPERQLTTLASQEEYHKCKFAHFLACDDTSLEERLWVTVKETLERNGREGPNIEINHQGGSRTYLYASTLEQYAYNAAKEGTPVVPLDWSYAKDDLLSVKAWLLIDFQARYCYGLRFELKTTTGSLVAERPLPNLYI